MSEEMDSELKTLLAKSKLHSGTIDFLEKAGCLTTSVFAEWVDERSQWTELLKQMPSKDVPGEGARMKAVWKQVVAAEATRIKREADGIAHTDMEKHCHHMSTEISWASPFRIIVGSVLVRIVFWRMDKWAGSGGSVLTFSQRHLKLCEPGYKR